MSLRIDQESRLFPPGASFEVSGANEMQALELDIAHEVDPLMSRGEEQRWLLHAGSPQSLGRFVLSADQAVYIEQLQGVVIENAYDALRRAPTEGWSMDAPGDRPRKQDVTGNLGRHTVGVRLSGESPVLVDGERGVALEKTVWYVPSLTNFHVRRPYVNRDDSHVLTVRRFGTKARIVS